MITMSVQDRGLKERHPAEAPKDAREALHQLAFHGRLRIMLIHKSRAELVEIIGMLADDDERLRRQPVLP
jgi:hypothetical protein